MTIVHEGVNPEYEIKPDVVEVVCTQFQYHLGGRSRRIRTWRPGSDTEWIQDSVFRNRNKLGKWLSTCCANMRTWVQIPITQIKDGHSGRHLMPGASLASQGSWNCKLKFSDHQIRQKVTEEDTWGWTLFYPPCTQRLKFIYGNIYTYIQNQIKKVGYITVQRTQ